MILKLSHHLSVTTPVPPGVPPVTLQHHYSMDRGDISNLFVLNFSNHCGTHIDAPRHFVRTGLRIGQFDLADFIFEHPLCLDLPLGDGELLRPAHFEPHVASIKQCDLLLLRTGFTRVRADDPSRYRDFSPGMSIEGANYIAARFPALRAVGLDTISLAAMQHLDEGIEAHRILLGGEGRRFLIIEDMHLDHDLNHLDRVIALPILIDDIDSAPCTVMGFAN
jgi:arylformamidase